MKTTILKSANPIVKHIFNEMHKQGYNPYSLAKVSGVYEDAIRDVIRGKINIWRGDTLIAICKALNINSFKEIK